MSRLHTSFVLGYHGCDRSIAEPIITGKDELKPSESVYDWLGEGIYFWEADPERAIEWSREHGHKEPFVLGAVIDLGECLDLLARRNIELLNVAYIDLMRRMEESGVEKLPNNHIGDDNLRRELDCAVINHLHSMVDEFGTEAGFPKDGFDSVRGLFQEGPEIYENAGFREKTHVQIAVRNAVCIKGVFRVDD